MTANKLKAVRGMHDILPVNSGNWARMEAVIARVFSSYAYREIRMPIVEPTALFSRSIGEVTDIIEKEMYTFEDRNGESMSLRPEGTAGCVRACIEHSLLDTPRKLWYAGPMFRYERPQKGRQRQFHQVGAEAFGWQGAEIEAEMLLLNQRLWCELQLENGIRLQLNNIGSSESRKKFRAALLDYLEKYRDDLDADSQRRLQSNPLRILDSKDRDTQKILHDAPLLTDFVDDESRQKHDTLLGLLQDSGVSVEQNSRLVRGLDYYNDTVFEWVSDDLGAQATVCGGGRYDGLVEQLGGKPVPAVGFAMGLERLYMLLEGQGFACFHEDDAPDAYLLVADSAYQRYALDLAERLRAALPGFAIMQHLAAGSLKSEFKRADKSGARFALIVGEQEVADNSVSVKDLQSGEQSSVSVGDGIAALLVQLSADT
ncbi:MAG: histidine--tRNA ligase [Pseudomonadales bacterium]|nr:MAG: histidine--tRNA ligase [Pseudomonadales bacterium]